MLAEAEIKREITPEEAARIPGDLTARGFTFAGAESLCDYYLQFAPSPVHGYDVLRLRVTDSDRYTLARKEWMHDAAGNVIRLEEEHDVPAEEADHLLADYPEALLLEKGRRVFRGTLNELTVTCDLDQLTLRGAERWFLEAEVMTTPETAHAIRERLSAWLRDELYIRSTQEAPTMLELLLDA